MKKKDVSFEISGEMLLELCCALHGKSMDLLDKRDATTDEYERDMLDSLAEQWCELADSLREQYEMLFEED